jgi:membrane protein implicated in regulation of membrane protease activity
MVKQVRVIRNVAMIAAVFAAVLWAVRAGLPTHPATAVAGGALGLAYGTLYWRLLVRRIDRTHHRFARNRIFVRFISVFELALTAAASSIYVVMALGALFAAAWLFDWVADHRWGVLIACFGSSAALTLGVLVVRYEYRHGPLYYQYASDTWSGAEGMLYQQGTVTEPLAPQGRVWINGESWQAESIAGEPVGTGEHIEVLAIDGLTLRVDRVIADGGTRT